MDLLAGNFVLILCFLVGSALIVLEAYIPGFGVAGIAGIVLEVLAITSAWMYHGTVFALIITGLALLLIGLAIFFSYRSAMKGRLSKSPLILHNTESPEETAEGTQEGWVNREGVTVSAIRPEGFIDVDGQRLPACSGGSFIASGRSVRVVGVEKGKLMIRELSET